MKFTTWMAAAAALITLAGCGPQRVNLAAHRNSYNYYPPVVDKMEADYQTVNAQVSEILKATGTPSAAPYPQLKADLKECYRTLGELHAGEKKIEAFKKRYDSYAAGKVEVNSDDPAGWNEFRGVQAEYDGISSQMGGAISRYNAARKDVDKLVAQYGIAKTTRGEVDAEAESIVSEVGSNVDRMGQDVQSKTQALLIARVSGANPDVINRKTQLLTQAGGMIPSLGVLSKGVQLASKSILDGKTHKADQLIWTGPGMKGDISDLKALRDARDEYLRSKAQYDDLMKQFDAVVAPTPVPVAQPTAAPTAKP